MSSSSLNYLIMQESLNGSIREVFASSRAVEAACSAASSSNDENAICQVSLAAQQEIEKGTNTWIKTLQDVARHLEHMPSTDLTRLEANADFHNLLHSQYQALKTFVDLARPPSRTQRFAETLSGIIYTLGNASNWYHSKIHLNENGVLQISITSIKHITLPHYAVRLRHLMDRFDGTKTQADSDSRVEEYDGSAV